MTQLLNILHDIAKYSSILIEGERFVLDGLRSFSVSYIYTNFQSINVFVDIGLTRMVQAGTRVCSDKIDHCINIDFEYPVISPCRKIVIFYKVTLNLDDLIEKVNLSGLITI